MQVMEGPRKFYKVCYTNLNFTDTFCIFLKSFLTLLQVPETTEQRSSIGDIFLWHMQIKKDNKLLWLDIGQTVFGIMFAVQRNSYDIYRNKTNW